MGYEVPESPNLRLVFTDPSFNGLEVVCRPTPIGQLNEAASLADIDPKKVKPEDAEKVQRLISAFARALVSWNLTRKGRKVPATVKGVDSLDVEFVMQLVSAWLSAAGARIADQAQTDADVVTTLPVDALG